MNRLTEERLDKIAFGSVRQSQEEGQAMARELQQWREAAKKPVAWGLFHFSFSNGGLYNHCASLQAAEAYRDQIHHSSDSLTLEIKPLYTAPPTITVTLPELHQTSCSESEKYYFPTDVIEAIRSACAAAGIQCVIEGE